MQCTNCGQQVPDTANMCGYCGHRLKAGKGSLGQSQNLPSAEARPQAVSKQEKAPVIPSVPDVQQRLKWSFVLLWVGSYVCAFAPRRLYAVIVSGLAGFDFYSLELKWEYVMEALVGGLLIGLCLWLILRKRAGITIVWIPLTVTGILVSEADTFLFYFGYTDAISFSSPLLTMALGALLGTSQWFALRKSISEAYWWIAINSIALYLPYVVMGLIRGLVGIDYYSEYGYEILIWSIFGALTGIGMLWLLRNKFNTPFTSSIIGVDQIQR